MKLIPVEDVKYHHNFDFGIFWKPIPDKKSNNSHSHATREADTHNFVSRVDFNHWDDPTVQNCTPETNDMFLQQLSRRGRGDDIIILNRIKPVHESYQSLFLFN